MIRKEITFTDFDGNEVTETHLFHLTAPEMIRMDAEYGDGGIEKLLNNMVESSDNVGLMQLFEKLIRRAYGTLLEVDGKKRFVKNEKEADIFMNSLAYEGLFMELISSETVAAEFFNRLAPQVNKQSNNGRPKPRRG